MTEYNDFYQTNDLGLATALSLYIPIDLIDRANPTRVLFQFRKVVDLENLVAAYWNDKLVYSTRAYFSQLRYMKSRLREG